MTHHKTGAHSPTLDKPEQRDLQRKQPRLGEQRLIQQALIAGHLSITIALARQPLAIGAPIQPSTAEHHLSQSALQQRVKLSTHLIKRHPESPEHLVQLPAHPHTLRTLAAEQECNTTHVLERLASQHVRGRLAFGQQPEASQQTLSVSSQHHRPTRQRRPT